MLLIVISGVNHITEYSIFFPVYHNLLVRFLFPKGLSQMDWIIGLFLKEKKHTVEGAKWQCRIDFPGDCDHLLCSSWCSSIAMSNLINFH